MGRNLLLVTLVAIIFTLLIPITNHYLCWSEWL
jgi:hypothetical protein